MNRMDPRVLRNIARSSPHLANQISSQMNMGRIPTGPALPAPTSMPVAAPVANPYPATAGAAPMDPRVMRNIERSNPAAARTITNNMRGYDPTATAQYTTMPVFQPVPTPPPDPMSDGVSAMPDESGFIPDPLGPIPTLDSGGLLPADMSPTGTFTSVAQPALPEMTPQAQLYALHREYQDRQDALRRAQVQSSMASRQAQADASRRAQVDARAQQRALQDERTRMAGLRSQQYQANRPATSYTPQPMPSLTPNSGIGGLMGAGSAPAWGQPQNMPQQGPLQVSQPPAQPGFSKGAGMTRGIGSLPFGANMPRFDR